MTKQQIIKILEANLPTEVRCGTHGQNTAEIDYGDRLPDIADDILRLVGEQAERAPVY